MRMHANEKLQHNVLIVWAGWEGRFLEQCFYSLDRVWTEWEKRQSKNQTANLQPESLTVKSFISQCSALKIKKRIMKSFLFLIVSYPNKKNIKGNIIYFTGFLVDFRWECLFSAAIKYDFMLFTASNFTLMCVCQCHC